MMTRYLLTLPLLFISALLLAQGNPLVECREQAQNQEQDPDPIAQLEKIDKETRNCLIGKTFPFYEVTTISKKHYTKKDLEGKVVLLNFWSTGCEPCDAEMQLLQELSKTYGNQGFLLLSFTSEELPVVEKYLSEHKASFETVAGCGDLIENFMHMTFASPGNFFLNKKGQIVEVKFSGPTSELGISKVKEQFKKIIEAELRK